MIQGSNSHKQAVEGSSPNKTKYPTGLPDATPHLNPDGSIRVTTKSGSNIPVNTKTGGADVTKGGTYSAEDFDKLTSKHETKTVKSNKSIKALSDTPKQVSKAGKKTLKTTTKNIVSAGKQFLSAIPKPVLNVANVAKRFAGPVGVALTAYDAVKTVPKVVKSTKESLKKQAKGQKVGFRKL